MDRQIEVTSCILETFMCSFVGDTPNHWFSYLAIEEFWYNTSNQ